MARHVPGVGRRTALAIAIACILGWVGFLFVRHEQLQTRFRDAVWAAEQCEDRHEWDRAVEEYDRALLIDPSEPCIHYYRARALVMGGRTRDASSGYARARELWIESEHEEDSYGVSLGDIELALSE
jgi:tetratricopeptide (TPR) repeat protein